MKTTATLSPSFKQHHSLGLRVLILLLPLLLLAAGCGQDGGGRPSDRELAVKKARQELEARRIPFNFAAFVSCVGDGDAKAVGFFLLAGMDANTEDALALAALMGHTEIITNLLAHGASVDGESAKRGRTPLMATTNTAIAEILLRHGANVNAKDKHAMTPLMNGVAQRNQDKVRLLIEHGANVNDSNDLGGTALMTAAVLGQFEILQLLLASGARINQQDNNGRTALMYACGNTTDNALSCVEFLGKKGADMTIRDRDGQTASDHVEAAMKALARRRK